MLPKREIPDEISHSTSIKQTDIETVDKLNFKDNLLYFVDKSIKKK